MDLFRELKRRNVYKVGAAYAVVAWLLIQIATATFPVLEIPNWATKLVIALVVPGFPIALIFAWAFALTPEGIKRSEDCHARRARTSRPTRGSGTRRRSKYGGPGEGPMDRPVRGRRRCARVLPSRRSRTLVGAPRTASRESICRLRDTGVAPTRPGLGSAPGASALSEAGGREAMNQWPSFLVGARVQLEG